MGACAALDVRRTMRTVTQLYDRMLAPIGLRSTQLPILVAAARAPGATVKQLAEGLLLESSSMVRNLAPLQTAGLLELRRGERDRRTRTVWLTEAGEQTLADARPVWRRAQRALIQRLGADWPVARQSLSQLRTAGRDALDSRV